MRHVDRLLQRRGGIVAQHGGALEAIAPPALFGIQRPGRHHVVALQRVIDRFRRNGQFTAGVRQPAQRLFQQIVAVIRQAEIKHRVIVGDDGRRQRTLRVNTLLPQRARLHRRQAAALRQRQTGNKTAEAALLSAFAQRANIHGQTDFDTVAGTLRRGQHLPRQPIR